MILKEENNKHNNLIPLLAVFFLSFALLTLFDVWPNIDAEKPSIIGLLKSGEEAFSEEISFYKKSFDNKIETLAYGVKNDWSQLEKETEAFLTNSSDNILASTNFLSGIKSENSFDLSLFVELRILDVKEGFDQAVAYVVPKSSLSHPTSLHPIQTASSYYVLASVLSSLENGFQSWDNLMEGVWSNIIFYKDKVVQNWSNFFTGAEEEKPTELLSEEQLESLREELRAVILAEIEAEIQRQSLDLNSVSGSEPTVFQSSTGQGVIVLPASDSDVSNEQVKKELQGMFSDQTDIRFDASGQSGVITPIFRDKRGDDFIFIITPIKK